MARLRTEREFLADFLGRTTAARKLKFKTQWEMAEALGMGREQQSTYSKWESRSPLSHHLIQQFCRICDVRVDWLLTGDGPGPAWQPVIPEEKVSRKKGSRRRDRAA